MVLDALGRAHQVSTSGPPAREQRAPAALAVRRPPVDGRVDSPVVTAACRACGGEVAVVGVVLTLLVLDAVDQLRYPAVEIAIALAVDVARHVHADATDARREV